MFGGGGVSATTLMMRTRSGKHSLQRIEECGPQEPLVILRGIRGVVERVANDLKKFIEAVV